MTARELVVKWWDEAWSNGVGAASWRESLEGLTAEQAAWKPPSAPGVASQRHSIWQIVLHMVFWRESLVRRVETGQKPTQDELTRLNFPEIEPVSEAGWIEARRRLEETQARMAKTLRERGAEADPLHSFLTHDSYHFGQINMIRAMLGLPPIE